MAPGAPEPSGEPATSARRLPAQLPPIGWRAAQEAAKEVLRETRARPAPLGFVGFGLTAILLGLHDARLVRIDSAWLAFGLTCGGVAQLAGAVVEWRRRNRVASLAFGGYAAFWLSLVALILAPRFGLAAPSDHSATAAYLFFWGLFTVALFVGSFRTSLALMATLFLLTMLFLLLAFADATQSAGLTLAAGWVGIATGLGAVYVGAAETVNAVRGRTVLPMGEPRG
jgi:succinate-acetate transporter protein